MEADGGQIKTRRNYGQEGASPIIRGTGSSRRLGGDRPYSYEWMERKEKEREREREDVVERKREKRKSISGADDGQSPLGKVLGVWARSRPGGCTSAWVSMIT